MAENYSKESYTVWALSQDRDLHPDAHGLLQGPRLGIHPGLQQHSQGGLFDEEMGEKLLSLQ